MDKDAIKNQTAVEWLFEQVVNRTERVYFLKELEQAKEMEKQQVINSAYYFLEDAPRLCGNTDQAMREAEEYFNKTHTEWNTTEK